MDQDRVETAIEAFQSAGASLQKIVQDAEILAESAESIRATDKSVLTVAAALGQAGAQWSEVAASVKDVTAEIQAATKLLEKAAPQELMDAINDADKSIGVLQDLIVAKLDFITSTSEQILRGTERLEKSHESFDQEVAKGFSDTREALHGAIRTNLYVSGTAAVFALAATIAAIVW